MPAGMLEEQLELEMANTVCLWHKWEEAGRPVESSANPHPTPVSHPPPTPAHMLVSVSLVQRQVFLLGKPQK